MAKYTPEYLLSVAVCGWQPLNSKVGHPQFILPFLKEGEMQSVIDIYEQVVSLPSYFKQTGLTNDRKAMLALLENEWESFEMDLPNLKLPFLIMSGDQDDIFEPSKEAVKKIPNASFQPLVGDHFKAGESRQVIPHLTKFHAILSP